MSGADISPCGKYRYRLMRETATLFHPSAGRMVNWIMLNPSTADATRDDPTIRRCRRFAADWGYDRLVVTNLFAFRATDPDDLRFADDPIGPENDRHILGVASEADLIVYAWGQHGGLRDRARIVRDMLRDLPGAPQAACLKLAKNGQPWHPLYVEASATPIPLT